MARQLDKDLERVLFSEEELDRRVGEIAAEITRDYAGREPLLISVLRGSFVFMADLVRKIDLPCTVDFMAVSSYGGGTSSSGQVKIVKDLSETIPRQRPRAAGGHRRRHCSWPRRSRVPRRHHRRGREGAAAGAGWKPGGRVGPR